VNEGEIFGFLGPNGAGKSTAIRILLGLIKPSQGEATVNGYDVLKDSMKIRQQIGYLPGEIALPPAMTAMEVIEFSLSIHQKGKEKALRLFDRFSLSANKRVKEMSKGMKQKVGIINAFCHDPAVLILDEPTSGLDPIMQVAFNELLLEEKSQGKTIFMSSHILSDVEHICDRIAMINKGRLHHVGMLEELTAFLPYKVTVKAEESCINQVQSELEISQLYFDGHQYQFEIYPPLHPLFTIFSSRQIDRATIQVPSLEGVFKQFYQGGKEE
jgi:ABC-2 type transport system ATP-binding protein